MLDDYNLDYTDAATVVPNLKTLFQVGRGMVLPGEDVEEAPTTEAAGPALPAAESKATATALPNDGGPTAERASQRASLRAAADTGGEPLRSEEHTSELQSLMRRSDAVF